MQLYLVELNSHVMTLLRGPGLVLLNVELILMKQEDFMYMYIKYYQYFAAEKD